MTCQITVRLSLGWGKIPRLFKLEELIFKGYICRKYVEKAVYLSL